MKLIELYQQWAVPETMAHQLLAQTHWFTVNAEFDPKTGEALPQALSAFLAKLSNEKPSDKLQDRLYRITEHARPAVERLLRTLNESPRREHAILHVRAVRELDAGSFIKLSIRPGRNIREKLAGKPYLQAVRRVQSVDLPENRLLKVFVSRLAELLQLRRDILREPEDELLPKIRSWLLSDEARAIGNWDNPPANNTLLAHPDYRRVWDSWRRLQCLNEDIESDLSRLDERRDTMRRWMDYGHMYREGTYRFADMPVLFDYEKFTIRPWSCEPIFQKSTSRVDRSRCKKTVAELACIDLAELRPLFATTKAGSQILTETYLWQQWRNANDTVDLTLFNSDAVYLHSDTTTIAAPDLFFARHSIPDHLLDRAARAFAARLRDTFTSDKLIWLAPDAINDFELDIIRRNLNARFPNAEPLPRSVAALFERIDDTRITNDGYSVVVVDTIGGTTCATKLIARFDADLEKRLPETKGYYWERCPPVVLSKPDTAEERRYDMFTVDSNGEWHNSATPERSQHIDPQRLKSDNRIGQFAFCINLSSSPVTGGIYLYALQARAGDIPLWRDQIPELAIKGYINGFYRRFYLVSRGKTITPIRGLAIPIPIAERFTLPAGRRFYQFPLYQGENSAELRFSARLDSPAFPLKRDTECELILTFQYGDDEPYTLVFAPLDKSFPPVRATWQRTVEDVVTNAPAPEYPTPMSWADLRSVPKRDSAETSDLLEWVISAIDRLEPCPRTIGVIVCEWRKDRNGKYFTSAECDDNGTSVFIHEGSFVEGSQFDEFAQGDRVSFELQERADGGLVGLRVGPPDYQEPVRLKLFAEKTIDEIINNIHKSLYFPIIQVWRDGRSLKDRQCPKDFAKAAKGKVVYLASLLDKKDLPQEIKNEVLFLLACLHKDAPDKCIRWITDQVTKDGICNPRAVGFALGDVSQKWQRYIFDILASKPHNAISVFAYAIWREQHFVEQFSLSALEALLNALLQRLKNVRPFRRKNDRDTDTWARRKWARATTEPLELLLGLLRTRASVDPDIRMLLQPHQEITKQFAEQIDRIEDIFAETDVKLFSRVQIEIQKPEGVRTPDLLYALRLYLTGDDGANAIHITGLSDTDDD